MMKAYRLHFAIAAAVLVPVEWLCVRSALETQGEVMQGLLSLFVCLNVICFVLFWWLPRIALAGLLLLFAAVVPYQVVLLNRLSRITNEVGRFVHQRTQLRSSGAPLPKSIEDYTFADPSIRPYFYSYDLSEDAKDFTIAYFVVQPGITHWYNSKTGWGYYPD